MNKGLDPKNLSQKPYNSIPLKQQGIYHAYRKSNDFYQYTLGSCIFSAVFEIGLKFVPPEGAKQA